MQDWNLKNLDPRTLGRVAEHIGSRAVDSYLSRPPQFVPSGGPMISPQSSPGPGGPGGGYMRYREMTIDEMLLENRVVFLVGEINHASAANCYMRLLYLQSVKREADINQIGRAHV